MLTSLKTRKPLPTNTANEAKNWANELANKVAAAIEAHYKACPDHPFIADADFTHMLECIDESITEGFWEAIREEERHNSVERSKERSYADEHRLLACEL